jgi:hypothetical protein
MLMTVMQYRAITSDYTTDAITVTARIEEATSLIEESLGRHLQNGEYTEALHVWYGDPSGPTVYPTAVPLTGVPADSSWQIATGSRRLCSKTWSSVDPYFYNNYDYTDVAVTYSGGFTAVSLPVTLRRSIAMVAYGLEVRQPELVASQGYTSRSVGDVSVGLQDTTSAGSELEALAPGVWNRIRRYKLKRLP